MDSDFKLVFSSTTHRFIINIDSLQILRSSHVSPLQTYLWAAADGARLGTVRWLESCCH